MAKTQVQHTAGPWRVAEDGDIVAAGGVHVVCFGHDYDDYGYIGAEFPEPDDSDLYRARQDANARLIAAAPDLLQALKDALRLADLQGQPRVVGIMQLAIAKAEGGAA